MSVGPIEPFKIETEADADAYLHDLLKLPDNHSIDVIEARAALLIDDKNVRSYFIGKAKEHLKG